LFNQITFEATHLKNAATTAYHTVIQM